MPVGGGPEMADAGYLGQFLPGRIPHPAWQQQFDDETMSMREAAQMIDHFQMWFEAGLGDFGWFYFEVIDHGDAVENIKVQPRIVTQVLGYGGPVVGGHDDVRIKSREVAGLQNRSELFVEVLDDVGSVHS